MMKRILSVITGILIILTLVILYRFISTVIYDEGLLNSMEFYQVFWLSQLMAIFLSLIFGYFITLKLFRINKFTFGKAILIIISISLFAAVIVFFNILFKQRNLQAYADYIDITDMFEHDVYEVNWKRILGPLQFILSIGVVIFSAVKARKKAFSKDDFNEVLDN
jgi:hypothetical protein